MLETVISWKTWKTECIIKFKLSLNCDRCLTITSGLNVFSVLLYKNIKTRSRNCLSYMHRRLTGLGRRFEVRRIWFVRCCGFRIDIIWFGSWNVFKLGTWWNLKKFSKNFIFISYRNDLNLWNRFFFKVWNSNCKSHVTTKF